MSDKRADSVAFVRETFLAEQPAPAIGDGCCQMVARQFVPNMGQRIAHDCVALCDLFACLIGSAVDVQWIVEHPEPF